MVRFDCLAKYRCSLVCNWGFVKGLKGLSSESSELAVSCCCLTYFLYWFCWDAALSKVCSFVRLCSIIVEGAGFGVFDWRARSRSYSSLSSLFVLEGDPGECIAVGVDKALFWISPTLFESFSLSSFGNCYYSKLKAPWSFRNVWYTWDWTTLLSAEYSIGYCSNLSASLDEEACIVLLILVILTLSCLGSSASRFGCWAIPRCMDWVLYDTLQPPFEKLPSNCLSISDLSFAD